MSLLRFISWLIQRRTDRYEREYLAERIRPPKYRFEGMDEALRARTEQRRRAAEGIRGRAARLESGSRVGEVMRLMRGA